ADFVARRRRGYLRALDEKALGFQMCLKKAFNAISQVDIAGTCSVEKGGSFRRRCDLKGVAEDVVEFSFGRVHDFASRYCCKIMRVWAARGDTERFSRQTKANFR